jgi:hypothetical protein
MESLVSSLRIEPRGGKRYRTRDEARVMFDYIKRFYNTRRSTTL